MNHRLTKLVVVCALLGTTATVGSAGTASAAAAAKYPDLLGTWQGPYRFPSSDNTSVDSHQKLVIDHQDGELIWGYDEFVEADGTDTRIPVRGSIDFDHRGFGLAETGGMFIGRITGKNKITVRFFLTATTYTSFDAKLTRKSSP
jgi:hypothetical protein